MLCSAVGTAAAQLDDEPARVVVGPMAGVSLSTLRGSGVGDVDFNTTQLSPFTTVEIKNQAWEITLGYKIAVN